MRIAHKCQDVSVGERPAAGEKRMQEENKYIFVFLRKCEQI